MMRRPSSIASLLRAWAVGSPGAPWLIVLGVLVVLVALRNVDFFILRLDESPLGENILHKAVGFFVIVAAAGLLGWRMREIGFRRSTLVRGTVGGLVLAGSVFAVIYTTEILLLVARGESVALGLFALLGTGDDAVASTAVGVVAWVLLGNVVNVLMEESAFRGLFPKVLSLRHRNATAIGASAVLFGAWHYALPLRQYLDGVIDPGLLLWYSTGYMGIATLFAIKLSLLVEMTGGIWVAMADHFVNNASLNLLHVVTDSGVDEFASLRVVAAQLLSFAVVVTMYATRSGPLWTTSASPRRPGR